MEKKTEKLVEIALATTYSTEAVIRFIQQAIASEVDWERQYGNPLKIAHAIAARWG